MASTPAPTRRVVTNSRRIASLFVADLSAPALAVALLLLVARCAQHAAADYGALRTVNLTADPFGDKAYVAAPPEYPLGWLADFNQVFPSSGWCLNETEGRVLDAWSSPLYSMPLVLAAEGTSGISFAWGWILKILLQEVVGYQTAWYDQGTSQTTFYKRLVLDAPERHSDLEIQSFLLPSAPTADYIQHVLGDGSVASRGSHSQTNKQGIYFSAAALARHPELALESWRAWTLSDANAQQATPLYPNGEVLELFRNDTWEVLDEMRAVNGFADMLRENPYEPFNPANPAVCHSTMTSLDGTEFRTGCDHPDYPSMYIPPQCWPNPREQCAVMFSLTPVWVGTYTQSIIRTLNLSIAVAFFNVQASSLDAFVQNSANRMLLQNADLTVLSSNSDCTFNGRTVPCWQRVTLPVWSNECISHYSGNFYDEYSCDYPTSSLMKYSRADLAQTAPRADYLLQRADFTQADTKFIFSRFSAQHSYPYDHKSVACAWVRANQARWAAWIAPPPACSLEHTEAIMHPCDEDTATMRISYAWKLPKACVGGRALPPPDEVSCPLVSASRSEQTAYVVCAAVMCAFMFALIALRAAELLQQRRAAATASLLPSSSDKKGSGAPAAPQLGCMGRLSLFGRHMPVLQLTSTSFINYLSGMVLLSALPFVNFGPLSNARCWARYSLIIVGLTMPAQALLMMAMNARSSLERKLQSSERSNTAVGMRLLRIGMLVPLIVDACQTTMLAERRETAPGGGLLTVAYCASPSIWLVAVHFACMAIWCCGNVFVMAQLLLRIHVDSLCGSKRDYATTARAKAARRAARATRAQKLQVDSVALALLFGIGTACPLLWSVFLADEPDVQMINVVALVGPVTCCSFLFLPSVFHARALMQPSQQVTDAAEKDGRAGGFVPGQGDTIGGASLVHVLSDSLLLLHFRRFAEERFDGEALHFLLSVQQFFKRLRDSTLNLTQLLEELDGIVDEFVVAGAKQQVNLSSTLRDNTLAAVDSLRMHAVTLARERLKPASAELKAQARQCLQPAVSEVYQLVQWNAFPRFVASKTMVRSQKLLGWAEGFDECDEEEQSALLLRFKERQSQIRKQLIEASQTAGSASSDGEPRMQNNEAALLLFDMDVGASPTVAGPGGSPGGSTLVPPSPGAGPKTPLRAPRSRGVSGADARSPGGARRVDLSPAGGSRGSRSSAGSSGPGAAHAQTVTLHQPSTLSSNVTGRSPMRASPSPPPVVPSSVDDSQPFLLDVPPMSSSQLPAGAVTTIALPCPVVVHTMPLPATARSSSRVAQSAAGSHGTPISRPVSSAALSAAAAAARADAAAASLPGVPG